MSERGEGFAARWSRRKQEVRVADEPAREADRDGDGDAAEVAALTPAAGDIAAPAQQAPSPDPPPPDLPTIDSLTSESDFSQFMREGVPEELRRLALRKLWRLTPIIPDGLDDYDEDYSMIGIVAQKVSTLFKPGEGMRDPEEETASAEPTDAGDADAAAEEKETEEKETEETKTEETESEEDKTAEKDVDDEPGGGADDADTIDDEVDDADGEIA